MKSQGQAQTELAQLENEIAYTDHTRFRRAFLLITEGFFVTGAVIFADGYFGLSGATPTETFQNYMMTAGLVISTIGVLPLAFMAWHANRSDKLENKL